MTTIDMIYAEIEQVDEMRLEALYEHIKQFTQEKPAKRPSLMARLREIKIDGPEDFASNFDLYMSGEKQFE